MVEWVGRDTGPEDQDSGLVSAAVAWAEAAEAPVDLGPAEAARGVAPAAVVEQVRVGVCGGPAVELARDPGAGARARRVRVEEPGQGAAQAVEELREQEVEAAVPVAVAPVPVPAVVPVVKVVGPARSVEELQGVRGQERLLQENG